MRCSSYFWNIYTTLSRELWTTRAISVASWILLKLLGCTGNQSTTFDWVVHISVPLDFNLVIFLFMPIETSMSGKMEKRTCTMKIRSDSENCHCCRCYCCRIENSLQEAYTHTPHTRRYEAAHTFVMWCESASSYLVCVCKMRRAFHSSHPNELILCSQSDLTIVIYAVETNRICKEQFIPKPKRIHMHIYKARGRKKTV